MDPYKLTLSITTLANILAHHLPDEDLDIVAAAATQLGDTLATISIQRTRRKALCDKSTSNTPATFPGHSHNAIDI